MANEDLKKAIYQSCRKNYEIAKQLNMAPSNFSALLRYELSKNKKDEILKAIKEMEA